jgi:hypothetical protein
MNVYLSKVQPMCPFTENPTVNEANCTGYAANLRILDIAPAKKYRSSVFSPQVLVVAAVT